MNWPDYVVLAEKLVTERFEASKRSAVSRAYRVHAEVWGVFEAGRDASAQTGEELKLIADLGTNCACSETRPITRTAFRTWTSTPSEL